MKDIQVPKFSPPKENFARELRREVEYYFQSQNISKFGGKKILIKSILLIIAFIFTYSLLLLHSINFSYKILLSILLGILTSLIGFNIMHDGAHHTFSTKKWLNSMAGYTLNFLGANVFIWKTKHNLIHHTYTNIPKADDDIDAGIFIFLTPNKKKYWFHKFQHIYFPVVYAFLYFYWIFFSDFQKYVYKKIALTNLTTFTTKEKIIFWSSKLFYAGVFILLPALLIGIKKWLLLFLIYGFTTGLLLSIVFQLAHIVEETEFPEPNAHNIIEDEWMKHQLKTTANFSMKSKIITWLLGGLNYQIEHHLFPSISHIHYPNISQIVQSLCIQFNIPYYAHPNMLVALHSHYKKLKHLSYFPQS